MHWSGGNAGERKQKGRMKKKQFLYKEKVQGHFWVFKKLLGAPAMLLGAPSNFRIIITRIIWVNTLKGISI